MIGTLLCEYDGCQPVDLKPVTLMDPPTESCDQRHFQLIGPISFRAFLLLKLVRWVSFYYPVSFYVFLCSLDFCLPWLPSLLLLN